MEKIPFFSIVSVTKDNLPGLRFTHESLQTQRCRDFEWIVMDGASTDGTPDFLKTTGAHWISQPDSGIYDAMNKGLARARGDYVMFLNGGDMLADENTLAWVQKTIADCLTRPDFVYGDSWETDGKIRRFKPARSHRLRAFGMFTHHQAMFYRRTALEKAGARYSRVWAIAADYAFTLDFLDRLPGWRVLRCRFPICNFQSGGLSQQQADIGRREQAIIRQQRYYASRIVNWAVTLLQDLAWRLRGRFPNLYWRLKSYGNTPPGSAQSASPAPPLETRL